MFFGTKLIIYQRSFDDLLNVWCFYSITTPHYANHSSGIQKLTTQMYFKFLGGQISVIIIL